MEELEKKLVNKKTKNIPEQNKENKQDPIPDSENIKKTEKDTFQNIKDLKIISAI
jgi:hypothetical protein